MSPGLGLRGCQPFHEDRQFWEEGHPTWQGGQLLARLACAFSHRDRTIVIHRAGSLFLILVGGPRPIPFLPLTIYSLVSAEPAQGVTGSPDPWVVRRKDVICLHLCQTPVVPIKASLLHVPQGRCPIYRTTLLLLLHFPNRYFNIYSTFFFFNNLTYFSNEE